MVPTISDVRPPAKAHSYKTDPWYRENKKRLADREWRLDNLYWIKDKDGIEVPFKRNAAQMHYSGEAWYRDVILKSRQLGFSSEIAIEILDECLFRKNTVAGIIDLTLDDATAKLAKLKFAYDKLPEVLRDAVPLVRANTQELAWANGSQVSVGTSYRGGTVRLLHTSEFGRISAKKPDIAREIVTGAFPAVPKDGRVWVESTAEGTSGRFFDMVQRGRKLRETGAKLTTLDFKFHFFGWHMDPANRIQSNLVAIPPKMAEYFAKLYEDHGIVTDADQRAWYVKTREELGPDDIFREHPSVPDEAFFASLEGAYWKAELAAARAEKRIGLPVPHDPTRPVNTFWDIGRHDSNALWFHQTDGVRHRFIDYWEAQDTGLVDCILVLREKQMSRRFAYGKHYGPHDLGNTEWASQIPGQSAQTRKEIAKSMGIDIIVVPRIQVKADSIEAGRRMLASSYFCSENTQAGVNCLDNYTKKWNKTLAMFMQEPAKNGAQHGADAFQQGALGLRPEKMETGDRHRPRDKPRGTQWGV